MKESKVSIVWRNLGSGLDKVGKRWKAKKSKVNERSRKDFVMN